MALVAKTNFNRLNVNSFWSITLPTYYFRFNKYFKIILLNYLLSLLPRLLQKRIKYICKIELFFNFLFHSVFSKAHYHFNKSFSLLFKELKSFGFFFFYPFLLLTFDRFFFNQAGFDNFKLYISVNLTDAEIGLQVSRGFFFFFNNLLASLTRKFYKVIKKRTTLKISKNFKNFFFFNFFTYSLMILSRKRYKSVFYKVFSKKSRFFKILKYTKKIRLKQLFLKKKIFYFLFFKSFYFNSKFKTISNFKFLKFFKKSWKFSIRKKSKLKILKKTSIINRLFFFYKKQKNKIFRFTRLKRKKEFPKISGSFFIRLKFIKFK